MSNKTQLQANNTQLASLIQTLQGKAAGSGGSSGGGSVATCEFTVNNTITSQLYLYYMSIDGCVEVLINPEETAVYNVMQPSLVYIDNSSGKKLTWSGNCTRLSFNSYYPTYQVNGATTVTIA